MQDKIARFWHRKIAKDAREITIMPAVRWGNILYFILNCYSQKKFLVASKPQTDNWLELFPELKNFFLEPGEVKNWDFTQGVKNYYQFLDDDFSYDELRSFIETFFLKSAPILEAKKNNREDILYINVRRGDYYTENHAPIYGFNIAEFLKKALEKISPEKFNSVKIISDDIAWCRKNLAEVLSIGKPLFFQENLTAEESFLTLATAKNLILSNSTFCYWAAYISTFLYKNDGEIIGPDFGNRQPGYYHPKQYLPEWKRVANFDYEMPFS